MPDRKFRFTHSSTSPMQIHIRTDQNSVFQTNKHKKKENPKGNEKKKEEKPLIARFSTGSQFLIFFFFFFTSSVSLHHNMTWLSKSGMGWQWPAVRIFIGSQMSSEVWWQKMARVFLIAVCFFYFILFFFNVPKKQSNGVVAFKTI